MGNKYSYNSEPIVNENIEIVNINDDDIKKQVDYYPILKNKYIYTFNHSYQFLWWKGFLHYKSWDQSKDIIDNDNINREWKRVKKLPFDFKEMCADGYAVYFRAENDRLWFKVCSHDDRDEERKFTSKKVFQSSVWEPRHYIVKSDWNYSNMGPYQWYLINPDDQTKRFHEPTHVFGEPMPCSHVYFLRNDRIDITDQGLLGTTFKLWFPKGCSFIKSWSTSGSIIVILTDKNELYWFVGNFDSLGYNPLFNQQIKESKIDETHWVKKEHNLENPTQISIVQNENGMDKADLYVISQTQIITTKLLDSEWKVFLQQS